MPENNDFTYLKGKFLELCFRKLLLLVFKNVLLLNWKSCKKKKEINPKLQSRYILAASGNFNE